MNTPRTPGPTLHEGLAFALDCFHRGAYGEAMAHCEALMPAAQTDVGVRTLMGATELALNNPSRAVAHYTAVTQYDAHSADAWYGLAVALHRAGRLTEARANYQHALRLNPSLAAAIENLGAIYHQLGNFKQARDHFKRALEIKPRNAHSHWNLALVYEQLAEHDLALQHLQRAVELDPTQRVWTLQYATLLRTRDPRAAEHLCSQLLKTHPDYAEAWNLLGRIQLARRQFVAAKTSFERALAIDPAHAYAHYNRGWALMLLDDYAGGWHEFAWRRQRPDFSQGTTPSPHGVTEWRGEPLAHKKVLVKCEQGLGDTIMFCRFVAALTRAGAEVTLECPARMAPLLRTAPGIGRVIEQYQQDAAEYDYFVWLLDLPLRLGLHTAEQLSSAPYLRADETRLQRWRKRLPDATALRVGLIWRGNAANPLDRSRSIPLDLFARACHVPDVEFIPLQKDASPSELATLRRHMKLRVIDDPLDEDGRFLDTAAILTRLDVLVTVDTSGAHLAGALGIPVWLLVATNQDWRWGTAPTTTPWYSTMSLYRQHDGDWSATFNTLHADLVRLAAGEQAVAHAPDRRSTSAPPTAEDVQLTAGLNALRAGDLARAESLFAQIPASHPNYAAVLNYRAVAALQSGDNAHALQWLEEAVARAPQLADARVNLARVLQEHGDSVAALKHYRAALASAPDHAVAHANLGSLYHELRRIDEAITHYRRACQAAPEFAVPYNNLGLIALEQGRYEDAVELFERALRLDPQFSDAWCHLGDAHRQAGHFDRARQAYDSALAHDPSHAGAHWRRAMLSMLENKYPQAWADHAWGYAARQRRNVTLALPTWRDGVSVDARSVLVYPEADVDSELFSARFASAMAAHCTGVTWICEPSLQPLLQRSFPEIIAVGAPRDATNIDSSLAGIDFAIGTLDLLQALRVDTPLAPAQGRFLLADAQRVDEWRNRWQNLPVGPRIGIRWHGGTDTATHGEMSIPLREWQEVLRIPGVQWIALQSRDDNTELSDLERTLGVTLHDPSKHGDATSIDERAALLASLDWLIVVDSLDAHLAGALGVPGHVLLPIAPRWYWGVSGSTTAWYPRLRLVRQSRLGDWSDTMRTLATAVEQSIAALARTPTVTESRHR